MTRLKKKISRVTLKEYSTIYTRENHIVVSFLPGDVLEFKELRSRARWTIPIDHAFRYAVRMKAFHDAAEKRLKKARGG